MIWYNFSNNNGTFPFYVDIFLFGLSDQTCTGIDNKLQCECFIRNRNPLPFASTWVHSGVLGGFRVVHLFSFLYCFFVVVSCLRSVFCAHCSMYLWIVHYWLPRFFWRLFIYEMSFLLRIVHFFRWLRPFRSIISRLFLNLLNLHFNPGF